VDHLATQLHKEFYQERMVDVLVTTVLMQVLVTMIIKMNQLLLMLDLVVVEAIKILQLQERQ
jgi:hypothetical protein